MCKSNNQKFPKSFTTLKEANFSEENFYGRQVKQIKRAAENG
jgi:hypothetical protein